MQRVWLSVIALLIILGQNACSEAEGPDPEPDPCETILAHFDRTFGLQYERPDIYVFQGEQSVLDSSNIKQIRSSLGSIEKNIPGLLSVVHWVNTNFTWVNAGGSMIGQVTANELFRDRELYGCHSAALMISSILRSYDFPCLLVETASVKWANDFRENKQIPFVGHVMTEVFVNGAWILLDNNGAYIMDYDPYFPFISTIGSSLYSPAPSGLFAIGKGLDSWEYGVHSSNDTESLMKKFSRDMHCYAKWFGSLTYAWE